MTFNHAVKERTDLQYGDAAVGFAWCVVDVAVEDDVVVNVVVIDLSPAGAVPTEVLVFGGEDELAPAVVDVDLEVVVLHLSEGALRDFEEVVEAVAVGCEGVGQ